MRQENNEEECRIERREEPGGENSENYELLKLSGDSVFRYYWVSVIMKSERNENKGRFPLKG